MSGDAEGKGGPVGSPMSEAMRRIRTRSVQGGHHGQEGEVWPVTPPIVTSTAYATHDPDLMLGRMRRHEPTYNRDHFPNVTQLEEVVADLEGAEGAYATASGMAAIALVALSLLSAGDHLVLGAGGYSDTEELFTQVLPRFGIAATVVDVRDETAVRAAITPHTRMVFAETITNPGIVVTDIPMLARIARVHGVALVIDNTLPSPALCRPLEHGADLIVHSVTKFLGGHHDLSAGVVVGGGDLMARVRPLGYLLGGVPGAHDAALALRGIRTLVPRMRWITDSALEVARYLSGRPEIARVRYPGLAEGAERELAATLMPDGCGGVMVVELAGSDAEATARQVNRSLRLIPHVASLGGEITTVAYPPRILSEADRQARTGDTSLRLSIGLEDPADLIADLAQALDAARR